jgi:serine/threonine-protein kinase
MDSAPRYEIKSRLGSGGTGHVFKAWDTHLQRYIALKRLRTGDPDNSADSLERIRREAMAMASTQHPNIVTIYDFGCDQDGPFVAMEFVDGETLAAVAEREWFDLKQFAELVTQTLGALAAAHHVNVLHRDLKPQNIMVTRLPTGQRQYKILDFGLARISSQALPQTMDKNEAICGTAHYLAPEQFSRQPLDGRTDLYALGCAYYYVLTHQMPFNGNNVTAVINAHLAHTVTPLAALRQDLPPEICNWVMRLFSRKPEDRPLSAAIALEQFVRLCRQLASGETLVPDKLTRRTQTYLAEKFAAADSEAQFATRPYTTAMTAPGFSRGGKRLLLLALLGAIIVALGLVGPCAIP